jgi:hypothetical protein
MKRDSMAIATSPTIRTDYAASAIRSACGIILVALVGCGPSEEITRTTEARIDFAKADQLKPNAPNGEKIPTRILGAIAQEGDGPSWFFKLMGPKDAVSKQEPAFDSFLSSIEFLKQGEKPLNWTLPEGWREGPRKGRYATLLTGPEGDSVELSVMQAGGNLLDNVNRWRGQVGLESVPEEKLGDSSKEVTTKQGRKVMRVDVSGMAGKGAPMPPFMKGQ